MLFPKIRPQVSSVVECWVKLLSIGDIGWCDDVKNWRDTPLLKPAAQLLNHFHFVYTCLNSTLQFPKEQTDNFLNL